MNGYINNCARRQNCTSVGSQQIPNPFEPERHAERRDVPVMSYIVFQPEIENGDLYSPERALRAGTLFKTLDKPFAAGGCAV
ncbi:MAG: spore coat associated protein CotJA [Clostridia bacterium]|nr:spore coat associated protein CotJA [Clostridia bacterium]